MAIAMMILLLRGHRVHTHVMCVCVCAYASIHTGLRACLSLCLESRERHRERERERSNKTKRDVFKAEPENINDPSAESSGVHGWPRMEGGHGAWGSPCLGRIGCFFSFGGEGEGGGVHRLKVEPPPT